MDLELQGKRALVTGSSIGIGAAIAASLAREGTSVVVHGRSEARARLVVEKIKADGGAAEFVLGDLGMDESAMRVACEAQAKYGGIDILVNNAGGMVGDSGAATWLDVTATDWLDGYNVNAVAAVRLIRELVQGMRDRGWGRIIQIASVVALSPSEGQPNYSGAKAAMLNLTIGLSKALANSGVTVNCVSPGMIQTPGIDAWLDNIGVEQGWGTDREKSIKFALQMFPQTVNRLGQPPDVGNLIAYLCSPLADFVNGANFRVDGGVGAHL